MKGFPILLERLFLRSPGVNVCFRIIIEGKFEKNEIEEAIKKICVRHPFLNSSVKIDDENNAMLVQNDTPVCIEFHKANETDWRTWLKKTDNAAFDFLHGPLVKFCVIRGKNIEIIFLGHHIVGDGIGYLNLVNDILLALDNRIDLTPQLPPCESADKCFKETVFLDALTKSYAAGLNKAWRKNPVRFSEKEYMDFFEQYRGKYIPNLYMASIEGDDSRKLLEKCKLNGLTVNEIITSAFSVATMEMFGNREIRLGIAVNVRNELLSEPKDCLGNYITGVLAKARYDPANDFISNAKSIAVIMKKQLTNLKSRHLVIHFLNEFDKDLIESIVFAAYGNFDHPASKKLAALIGERLEKKGLGISNLGRYDFYDYKNFNVADVQFIGPAYPANLLTIGFITVNDKLNLCLRYNEGEIKTDIIKGIYKRVTELLALYQ